MPNITSWEVNVILCLLSLGLPGDLIRYWVKGLKKTHEDLIQRNAIGYHCDRSRFVDMKECEMLYFSRADLGDRSWHFPKAVSNLVSIPVIFHTKYSALVEHYKINKMGLNEIE